jgi:hypothetical protein
MSLSGGVIVNFDDHEKILHQLRNNLIKKKFLLQ